MFDSAFSVSWKEDLRWKLNAFKNSFIKGEQNFGIKFHIHGIE